MDKSLQDEFIATVSHELRTPLTSIRGFSQTLLNSWDKIDDESKKKFVGIIEEQSNRLINLVENILAVSRINADKPLIRAVNVNVSIDKTVSLIRQKYPNHIIEAKYNNHLPPAGLDEDKFQQIMMNLTDNACKYSEEGSKVLVTTAFADSDNVIIKVRDNGVGIDKKDSGKIYEKFIRLENHLTSHTQGNGLGLYITKKLVESMKGEISFESESGKGTCFILKFPFYNPEEALKCSQQS